LSWNARLIAVLLEALVSTTDRAPNRSFSSRKSSIRKPVTNSGRSRDW